MDTPTIISLVAVVVSILALPMSYFVATRQVKVGLDEHEGRAKRRTRLLVAERLDELQSLFFSATNVLAKIDLRSGKFDPATLEKYMPEIDSRVQETGILDRLAKSIDEYVSTGEPDAQSDGDIGKRLQIVRGQVSLASKSSGIYVTWNILDVCKGGNLSSHLRAIKSA
jgi:hypothetical protein